MLLSIWDFFDKKVLGMPWLVTAAFVIGVPVAIYFMVVYYKKKKKSKEDDKF